MLAWVLNLLQTIEETKTMQTHQYTSTGAKPEDVVRYANEYAKNGWRLISTYKDPYDRTTVMMIFERPLVGPNGETFTWHDNKWPG